MSLGQTIRRLRKEKGVSIKVMAPELEIDHSYLSKIENDYITPSAEVLDRMAKYLKYNKDELMILANRVPDDIMEILRSNPKEAIDILRERFGRSRQKN